VILMASGSFFMTPTFDFQQPFSITMSTSTQEPPHAAPTSKPAFTITPPLLNSANPWATTYDDLKALYDSPYTGAVTIRTSLWDEFIQDPLIHQYTFFSASTGHATAKIDTSLAEGRSAVLPHETSSLNTLGYSPISFPDYLKVLKNMSESGQLDKSPAKPFIVSVTGTVFQVAAACSHLLELQNHPERFRWKPDGEYGDLVLAVEINLSCPNIPDKPPPAYDEGELFEYVRVVADVKQLASHTDMGMPGLHVGIKTPPFTYAGQFGTLIRVLEQSCGLVGGCPVSFITATNTLGNCIVMNEGGEEALGSANGMGIGGLAGDALHPLALGNVRMIRRLLDESPCDELRGITVVGVGGVSDAGGYRRMRKVGAGAVGVGTALGREGVGVFEKISRGLSEEDLKP
jgi:dihydroorotate dehydrogenase (fumarate)